MAHIPTRPTVLAVALLILLLIPATSGRAASGLVFSAPQYFGDISASTYDESGDRIGPARMHMQRLANGRVLLEVESGIEGGERSASTAELAPNGDGLGMHLIHERSQSWLSNGESRGFLTIDHAAGKAVCHAGVHTGGERKELALPKPDLVVNVPLNLLFQPLVHDDRREIRFQIFSCSFGPRLIGARARIVSRSHRPNGSELVEISYDLDIPAVFALLARPLLPDISIWFDDHSPGSWVGHRMPLFVSGPTVTVVRSGTSAPDLLGDLP